MSISDRLDEITARANAATSLTLGDDNASTCYIIVESDVPELVAALRAVLDRHERTDWGDGHMTCSACWDPTQDGLRKWPCPTVLAVQAALVEETA